MTKWITVILFLLCNLTYAQQTGRASFYSEAHHGKRSADGSIFNMHKLTAASNTFKLGTIVRVTNTQNSKSVVVKITDRGGFTKLGRVIDLSKAAFASIGDLRKGILNVIVEVIE